MLNENQQTSESQNRPLTNINYWKNVMWSVKRHKLM